MTEEIAKHYIEEMTHLYSDPDYSLEQLQDKQDWIDYLQSQIGALK